MLAQMTRSVSTLFSPGQDYPLPPMPRCVLPIMVSRSWTEGGSALFSDTMAAPAEGPTSSP